MALAVQPLEHSVCTVPGGLPGVSERFHRSTPGCASGRYYQLVPGGTTAAFQATEVLPATTGKYQEAVQPPLDAVQPLRDYGLINRVGAEGVLFSPPLPSSISCPSRRSPLHCPGVLVVLRFRGLSVDLLRGGPLLPNLFPWMLVTPCFLCSRVPPFFYDIT